MDWRTFFNEDHAIYVNARHRALHADLVARGMCDLLPSGSPKVLDWGCGEAEAAIVVAVRCATLYLYDSAPRVRDNLHRRYDDVAQITILDDASLSALPQSTLDAIVIVSVAQYLSRDAFGAVLKDLVPKLVPGGRLIVADVIPQNLSPFVDAAALLSFGARGGFLIAAVLGLVRTAFSNYSRLRSTLGITQWHEDDMLAELARHGLSATRAKTNIGHNQARMTFVGIKP